MNTGKGNPTEEIPKNNPVDEVANSGRKIGGAAGETAEVAATVGGVIGTAIR